LIVTTVHCSWYSQQ